MLNLCHPWKEFRCFELTETMCMVHIIYIKFTDSKAGVIKMRQDHYARQNNVGPIEMVEGNIPFTVG